MARQTISIAFNLVFILYYMGVLMTGQYVFQQETSLEVRLFTPERDASVLDEFVKYSCQGSWSYELS